MSKTFSIAFNLAESPSDLVSYIGIAPELFDKVISSEDRGPFYLHHQIPKRGRHRLGKVRDVWEVVDWRLAAAHKAVARRFERFARAFDSRFPHEAAYGYVRHRGTRDNAAVHCGAPLLLRADIRNFFPSISIHRLKERFIELGMHVAAAEALGKFVTSDGRLALGLNASPMLANLVCIDLDIKIQNLAKAYGCKYTRYADDIAISGKGMLPSRTELERIIESEGFQLNGEKFRQTKNGQAHYVTGLSISDAKGPHAPRRMKRRLRQELYYCKKFGTKDHLDRTNDTSLQAGVNRLNGMVHYVSHIETRIFHQLKGEWKKLQERDDVGASYEPLPFQQSDGVFCYVDETEITFGNKKFLALGLAFTDNANALIASTLATLREHQIEDPFYAGDKGALAKKGLHFVDSHPDLRTAYIRMLANLSFRAFVIYGELESHDKYQETYVSLLTKSLPKRLMWYDGAFVRFIFEENSKIKLSSLELAIGSIYQTLETASNRRPIEMPKVVTGKKLEHHAFAVPDYLLAVFARYAQANEKLAENNIRTLQFERLRDKYRLIVNADTGVEYSRRHPFLPWETVEK
jgi:RNA-directed DNA polymerase